MKLFKRILIIVLLAFVVVVWLNYPRLNLISGYAAKNMASNVFYAQRKAVTINAVDHQIASISIAKTNVDKNEKSATASVFGFVKRTAIYREGLGAVLVNDDFDVKAPYDIPKRNKTAKNLPFPFGNLPQKDTVFLNVDYKTLESVVNNAFDKGNEKKLQTRALLVIYKDQIIAEKYAKGFNKETPLLGWSMTKSITATIYGILEKERGFDIQKPVVLSAWKNDERSKITYNDLLHMNSGLAWEENYKTISDVTKMLFFESDMSKPQIDKPLVGKTGNTWNYASGTTNLLSGLLQKEFKNHQEYLDFWYHKLIDRIGMHSMLIESDLAGNFVGSSYGWATPRDWAKFGLLYLHKGNWNGDQIFKPTWAKYVAIPTETSNGQYGGHFWLNAGGIYPDIPKTAFSVNGYQGQRIFIFPTKDLVVVRMGLATMDFNRMLKDILATVK